MDSSSGPSTWGIEVLAAANYAEFEAAVDVVARDHDLGVSELRNALADLVTAVERDRDDPVEAVARETGIDEDTLLIGASKCRQHAVRKYPSKVTPRVYT
jgi:hypothetical protein